MISFILSLILSQRIYKFSKINKLNPLWVKWFNYARYFTGFLFAVEIILSASDSTRWIWHIFLIAVLLFAFQQQALRPLRMFILAFAPYVGIAALGDITKLILPNFYDRWNNYYDNAELLALIWLVAILFSHYRQNKVAEKERIQREKEDEINRAIAARKVELEGMVEERTAELTQQKEELEQTLKELRATQNQLIQSEKMASLGELTAGIAHEIQNPLNFVNNFSEVNRELLSELNEELNGGNYDEVKLIAKDLEDNEGKIMHHGKRAESIVKSMLQHSRGRTGEKELSDVNALADEYLRLSFHGLRAKDKSFNSEFELNADTTLPKIKVVPQDFGRVILNLLNNAFYAVSEKKKSMTTDYQPMVIITTHKKNNNLELVVKDNGNGINPKALDKIFQPFYTTKPTGEGTGLGLSMSYDIITKGHNGTLTVKSEEGVGTEFIISIPFDL